MLDTEEGRAPSSDVDRQRIALALASPKRADAGRYIAQQDATDDLGLFAAANAPRLL